MTLVEQGGMNSRNDLDNEDYNKQICPKQTGYQLTSFFKTKKKLQEIQKIGEIELNQ